MYFPKYVRRAGLKWIRPKGKAFQRKAISMQLSSALKQAQMANSEVSWTIHGSGMELFKEALDQCGSTSLDKHKVLFVAPTENLTPVLEKMSSLQMQLHDDAVVVNKHDSKSLGARTTMHASANEMSKFGGKAVERANVLKEEFPGDVVGIVGMAQKAYKFGQSIGSGAAVAGFSGSMTAGGVAGGLMAAANLYLNAKNYRTLLLSNSSNSAINPHMNPQKSESQLNSRITNEFGSGKAFLEAGKAILNRG